MTPTKDINFKNTLVKIEELKCYLGLVINIYEGINQKIQIEKGN